MRAAAPTTRRGDVADVHVVAHRAAVAEDADRASSDRRRAAASRRAPGPPPRPLARAVGVGDAEDPRVEAVHVRRHQHVALRGELGDPVGGARMALGVLAHREDWRVAVDRPTRRQVREPDAGTLPQRARGARGGRGPRRRTGRAGRGGCRRVRRTERVDDVGRAVQRVGERARVAGVADARAVPRRAAAGPLVGVVAREHRRRRSPRRGASRDRGAEEPGPAEDGDRRVGRRRRPSRRRRRRGRRTEVLRHDARGYSGVSRFGGTLCACRASSDSIRRRGRGSQRIRLRALDDEPDAFGSSAAAERDHDEAAWRRLAGLGPWWLAVDGGRRRGHGGGRSPRRRRPDALGVLDVGRSAVARTRVAGALLDAVVDWARADGAIAPRPRRDRPGAACATVLRALRLRRDRRRRAASTRSVDRARRDERSDSSMTAR